MIGAHTQLFSRTWGLVKYVYYALGRDREEDGLGGVFFDKKGEGSWFRNSEHGNEE